MTTDKNILRWSIYRRGEHGGSIMIDAHALRPTEHGTLVFMTRYIFKMPGCFTPTVNNTVVEVVTAVIPFGHYVDVKLVSDAGGTVAPQQALDA